MRLYLLLSAPEAGMLYTTNNGTSFSNAFCLCEHAGKHLVEVFTSMEIAIALEGTPECLGVGPDNFYANYPDLAEKVLRVETETGVMLLSEWVAAGKPTPATKRSCVKLAGE